tara:strand:+ start:64 stop:1752 length:1689 start_codon:yes stop_codon:yes gene_type:complete
MNNIVLRCFIFYVFLGLIKKSIYEIKYIKNIIFNFILYRKKNNAFKVFLIANKKLWSKKKNYYSKEKILISNFIATPGDIITNCIIAKHLEDKYKISSLNLSYRSKNISKLVNSFNIYENFFLQNKNLIFKIKIFFKVIFYLNKIKNIKNLYKFKLDKVYIGKIVLDHIQRHTGENLISSLNFKVFYHFYEALYSHYLFLKLIKEKNIKYVVQAETQFIPCGIIFQNCILKNIKLFAREGGPHWIGNTIYSKKKEIYTARDEIDENLFKYVKKRLSQKASREGLNKIKNRFKRKDKMNDWLVSTSKKIITKKQIFFTRKKICKKFSWDPKKKIICIFSHLLTDGNYVMGKRLFKSNLEWLRTTLETIAKNESVNFLVKPHPQESDYNTSTSTIKEFEKLGNLKHVKLLPENISQLSLAKIIDGLISSHGTAPLEYACYGVPSLTAGRSKFSYLNFFILPTKVSVYKKKILNLHLLKKLKNNQIKDARIFSFLIYKLIKVRCPLLPYFKYYDAWYEYSSNFWEKDCLHLLKIYEEKKDYFKEMLFYQIENKKRNMVNLKLLKN